jgi:hypothetical protein
MNFKIGEIVIFVQDGNAHHETLPYDKQELEILDCCPTEVTIQRGIITYNIPGPVYVVRAGDGFMFSASESCLRKLPSQNELTTWEDCVWQPNKETA